MTRRGQAGHLMVGLMSAIAIMMILSTVAVQAWVDVLRRDNEAEMIFRAEEIVRAIHRFQKDQGRLPLKLDELVEAGTKGQYFLRRKYTDPLVKGKEDDETWNWGLLYAAPGGGILDPNSKAFELQRQDPIGATTHRATTSPTGGLDTFKEGPRQVGGLAIIGVRTLSKDPPFRVVKGVSDYTQWLFTIYDLQVRQQGTPGVQPGTEGRPPRLPKQ